MSPLTIRAARLAAKTTSKQQLVFRRSFLQSARARLSTLMQPVEWVHHQPFTVSSQPADWGRILRSRATNLAIFIPAISLALGWPYLAAAMVDGSRVGRPNPAHSRGPVHGSR